MPGGPRRSASSLTLPPERSNSGKSLQLAAREDVDLMQAEPEGATKGAPVFAVEMLKVQHYPLKIFIVAGESV